MKTDINFIGDVLSLGDGFNEYGGLWDIIWWRTDGEYAPVTFFVNCNDVFYLSCSDCEAITPENIQLLKDSISDVRKILNVQDDIDIWDKEKFNYKYFELKYNSGSWGGILWVCRVRKERPIKYRYQKIPKQLHPLFDEAGPPRED